MRKNDNYPDFLVGVRCMTYNHHAYIEDAMNGFTMQQTTFPFVCVIVDDASTDGEPDVILRYMNDHFDLAPESGARQWDTDEARFLYARHRQNPNCYFGIILLKTNYYSQRKSKEHLMTQWLSDVKYYALCEGDDYWTDSNKLQKQVDILEKDPQVMLVHTAFRNVDYSGHPIKREQYEYYMRESRSGDVFERLLVGNYILTLTVCIRKEVLESEFYKECPYRLDYLLFLTAAALGNIYYINEEMGCYRMSPSGAIMSNLKSVIATGDSIRYYFYSKILSNKICKYDYKRTICIKTNIAEFAFNSWRHYNNKELIKILSNTTYSFYFYLFLAFLKKFLKKFTCSLWNL